MKKTALFAVGALAAFFLFLAVYNTYQSSPSSSARHEMEEGEEDEDEEDGIRLAQEQDFENTKDINLGYIPEDRLIAATENLARQRRAMRLNPNMRTQAALAWTERGPNTDAIGPSNGNTRGPGSVAATSGRMRAVWVDLSDASNKTVWVGGVAGGVWKTTDITAAPATWTPINDFLGNLAVASICQSPANPDIMYFGTGEKSYNVDAVRGGGIWKSEDHGLTWNLLPSTTGFWNISRLACDAEGNLYAAAIGNNSGIQRSKDGGLTWTNITPTSLAPRVTELKISSTGRLHIVCGYLESSAALAGYRYTDNPATVTAGTWTTPAVSFTPTQYNVEICAAGNTLYALPSNASDETPTIFKSTDGGANWAACTTNPPTGVNNNVNLSSGQGWYNLAIGVDPADPNKAVVGGLNTYRTIDGGATWTQVAAWVGTTRPYVHADQHFVTWNGDQVMIASDGGLFYSSDGGVNWSDRNRGLRLKQFYSGAIHPTSTNYFIAGAQDNGMHQMNTAGMGGSTEFIGGDGAFSHIDQDQPQYQFGSYVYNVYRRSTNSGSTWSTVTYSQTIGSFINPSDYDDVNNKMYATAANGQYVRWDNPQTGSTFVPVAVTAFGGGGVRNVMVSPYTANRVFFGMSNGRIVKVDNADQSLPTATNIAGSAMSASTVSCVAVGTDDNNLLATFSNYGASHVWMTTTGGGASGWTNISGNLPDIPVRWAMFYPYDNTKAILATEAGIYETDNINGAATVWTQSTSFPIVRTDMLQYRPSDGTVLAATHGRGLFTATIPVGNTYVQFGTTSSTRTERTTTTSGCTGYTDYTIYMNVNRAPTGAATATLNLNATSATQGLDFNFTTNGDFAAPSNVITFATGSAAPQPITLRIYDDASVESAETFTLTYTLSGSTDAVPAPNSQSFTFTITDNDFAPVVGGTGTATVGAGDYAGGYIQPFRSNFEKAKSQYIYLASELAAAGFGAGNITSLAFNVLTKTSTIPYTGLTISLKNTASTTLSTTAFETGTVPYYTGNYSTTTGINTFAFATPFVWNGTSNVLVEICYDNTSFTGSGDFVASNITGDSKGVWNRASTGTGCSLAPGFNLVGTSYVRPDVILTGARAGNAVETTLNAGRNAPVGSNENVYYYNTNGKVLARIQNGSAHNYGCTQLTLDRAGDGALPFWNANPANFLATKTFRVVPTTNNASGQYQITLYFTEAEKAAYEATTGQSWNNIKMVKVPSQISNYTPATPAPDGANAVEIVTPVLGTFGPDYTVTASFSTGFSGFGVGVPGNNPLPVTLVQFQGVINSNVAQLTWSTATEQNAKNFEVEKSTDGVNYTRIGVVSAAGNSATRKDYSLLDNKLSRMNYYRLRMNDLDGRNKLSQVVLLQYNAAGQNIWVVNNPFTDRIDIRLAKDAAKLRLQLVSANGSVVEEKQISNASGLVQWRLTNRVSAGSYILRSTADGTTFTNKLVRE